jgi:hypothetical protein
MRRSSPPTTSGAWDDRRRRGGNRTLLASILEAHPSSRGILFDQEHVVSRAKPVLQAAARLHHARRERDAVFEAVAA